MARFTNLSTLNVITLVLLLAATFATANTTADDVSARSAEGKDTSGVNSDKSGAISVGHDDSVPVGDTSAPKSVADSLGIVGGSVGKPTSKSDNTAPSSVLKLESELKSSTETVLLQKPVSIPARIPASRLRTNKKSNGISNPVSKDNPAVEKSDVVESSPKAVLSEPLVSENLGTIHTQIPASWLRTNKKASKSRRRGELMAEPEVAESILHKIPAPPPIVHKPRTLPAKIPASKSRTHHKKHEILNSKTHGKPTIENDGGKTHTLISSKVHSKHPIENHDGKKNSEINSTNENADLRKNVEKPNELELKSENDNDDETKIETSDSASVIENNISAKGPTNPSVNESTETDQNKIGYETETDIPRREDETNVESAHETVTGTTVETVNEGVTASEDDTNNESGNVNLEDTGAKATLEDLGKTIETKVEVTTGKSGDLHTDGHSDEILDGNENHKVDETIKKEVDENLKKSKINQPKFLKVKDDSIPNTSRKSPVSHNIEKPAVHKKQTSLKQNVRSPLAIHPNLPPRKKIVVPKPQISDDRTEPSAVEKNDSHSHPKLNSEANNNSNKDTLNIHPKLRTTENSDSKKANTNDSSKSVHPKLRTQEQEPKKPNVIVGSTKFPNIDRLRPNPKHPKLQTTSPSSKSSAAVTDKNNKEENLPKVDHPKLKSDDGKSNPTDTSNPKIKNKQPKTEQITQNKISSMGSEEGHGSKEVKHSKAGELVSREEVSVKNEAPKHNDESVDSDKDTNGKEIASKEGNSSSTSINIDQIKVASNSDVPSKGHKNSKRKSMGTDDKNTSKVSRRTDDRTRAIKASNPRSSLSSSRERHSKASNSVAIVSILLISACTVLTILGVYYKKITFSRDRYGQHVPLSTQDDDIMLYSRQDNTRVGADDAPPYYDSWKDIP